MRKNTFNSKIKLSNNFTKEGVFMYYNTQEDIITKLTESLREKFLSFGFSKKKAET